MGTMRKLRTFMASMLAAVPGIDSSDRVGVGYIPLTDDDDDFLNCLSTKGPFLLIHKGEIDEFNSGVPLGTFEIKVSLFFGYPKNEPYDYYDIEDLVEAICKVSLDQDTWLGTSASPKNIKISRSDLRTTIAGTKTEAYELTYEFYTM